MHNLDTETPHHWFWLQRRGALYANLYLLANVNIIFVSVNSSNAVDKREQPPRKDGCSLFHVNAKLRRKKVERRLQEKQIPIGLLSKQVVLQVEETAQFSGGGIRYKVKESVSEDALVLKDVQVCKRDSRKLVRHSGTSPGCVGLQNLKIGHWVSFPSFRHWVGD